MTIDARTMVLLLLCGSAASADVREVWRGDRESFERHFVVDVELFDESHGAELLMSIAPGPIEETARQNCRLDVDITYGPTRVGQWGFALALRGLLVEDVVNQKFYIGRVDEDDLLTLVLKTVPGTCAGAGFSWKIGLSFLLKEIFQS
jgi:hypothetical protein